MDDVLEMYVRGGGIAIEDFNMDDLDETPDVILENLSFEKSDSTRSVVSKLNKLEDLVLSNYKDLGISISDLVTIIDDYIFHIDDDAILQRLRDMKNLITKDSRKKIEHFTEEESNEKEPVIKPDIVEPESSPENLEAVKPPQKPAAKPPAKPAAKPDAKLPVKPPAGPEKKSKSSVDKSIIIISVLGILVPFIGLISVLVLVWKFKREIRNVSSHEVIQDKLKKYRKAIKFILPLINFSCSSSMFFYIADANDTNFQIVAGSAIMITGITMIVALGFSFINAEIFHIMTIKYIFYIHLCVLTVYVIYLGYMLIKQSGLKNAEETAGYTDMFGSILLILSTGATIMSFDRIRELVFNETRYQLNRFRAEVLGTDERSEGIASSKNVLVTEPRDAVQAALEVYPMQYREREEGVNAFVDENPVESGGGIIRAGSTGQELISNFNVDSKYPPGSGVDPYNRDSANAYGKFVYLLENVIMSISKSTNEKHLTLINYLSGLKNKMQSAITIKGDADVHNNILNDIKNDSKYPLAIIFNDYLLKYDFDYPYDSDKNAEILENLYDSLTSLNVPEFTLIVKFKKLEGDVLNWRKPIPAEIKDINETKLYMYQVLFGTLLP